MFRWSTLSLLCLGAPLGACRSPEAETRAPVAAEQRTGPALATGKGLRLTAADLEAHLRELPPAVRARAATPEGRRELLEQALRTRLLAQEARRQGLEREPEVARRIERLLVERLVQKQVEAADARGEPPEAELRAFYESRQEEFIAPERVRVSHIFLEAPEGSPRRAARQREAEQLRARLEAEGRATPAAEAFARVAREVSEDVTRAVGGDLTWRSHEELTQAHTRAFAEAAFALREGALSAVVATPKGFHVLRLAGRRPALSRTFEEARAELATRMRLERRKRAFDAFVEELRAQAGVVVDEAELARVGTPPGADVPQP